MADLPHRGRAQGEKYWPHVTDFLGDRALTVVCLQSFNQIFKEYEEKTGKKLNVTYRPESELRAAISKNRADIASVLQLDWGLGRGLVGPLDQLSVSDYHGWNPKTIADVLYS